MSKCGWIWFSREEKGVLGLPGSLDAQHIAQAAKEGDSQSKDSEGDRDGGVAGTLLGGSDLLADKVGESVAAVLGCNLLDHSASVASPRGPKGFEGEGSERAADQQR